ncbi:DUF4342 domain-containing protein [Clostridium sp. CS001]|uniref:DUF4342 domain-containing protein n=1 Tax=Clostridium sp. CS001 TaxID=2880648 RepID=UPI001CF37165|nr:DUF4342 domain-containing protein [Clostridium sp. CS001]MCB2288789.1 DUF4342 domain-containing protein [Clostridium sp. CS001]
MAEITLEKIDIIKERTGVSYTDAKEALEECDGDVVNALIYIEAKQSKASKFNMEEMYTTKDEFMTWVKDIIRKGNVTRVKIKKDETVVVDIPINAGIAAGIFGLIYPALIGIGVLTAVLTKVTIEITKEDGSVEVVNTIIKNTVDEVKERFNDTKDNFTKGNKDSKEDINDNVYKYTVEFDEKQDQQKQEEEK